MTPQCLDEKLWADMMNWQTLSYLTDRYLEPIIIRNNWHTKQDEYVWHECIGSGPYIRYPNVVLDNRKCKMLMEVAAWIVAASGQEILAVRRSSTYPDRHDNLWRWVKREEGKLVSLWLPERKKIRGIELALEFLEPIIARCDPATTRFMNMTNIHRDDFEREESFDTSRCFWCAVELSASKTCDWCSKEEDHWIPRYFGGTNRRVNIVPSCRRCNQMKLAMMPDVWLGKVKADMVKTHRCDLECAKVEYNTINWRALRREYGL